MSAGAHEQHDALREQLMRQLGERLLEISEGRGYDPDGDEGWAAVQAVGTEVGLGVADADDLHIRNRALCGGESGQLRTLVEARGFSLASMSRMFERGVGGHERRRKRDGVFYTPEWISRYIVTHTIGARLGELGDELELERVAAGDARGYERALRRYAERIDALAIVDPACGAGAFLLAAFERLMLARRWLATELARVSKGRAPFDPHAASRATLEHNLHGVDLDRESVDFTRLMLALRAAVPGSMPTTNICRGDALDAREFDWRQAFPAVFERRDAGFDCVIGNPPYVKLQQFRKLREDVAEYLVRGRTRAGAPVFESTQTGNFDLYLPFIENGVALLNTCGKLGYVAPSSWLLSEYGEGLRRFVRRTRSLARWIDFEGHQVFADATTYTALQFFAGSPQASVRVGFAPRGPEDLAALDSGAGESSIAWSQLPERGAWQLMPPAKLALWDRLRAGCPTLAAVSEQIAVGVQTSADSIYHLRKLGAGRYRAGSGKRGIEVALEDAIMRPLISGAEANRYVEPSTATYVLFPYTCAEDRATLISAQTLAERFPLAWAYLRSHERALRGRERGKMDRDDRWWGYNYPKNLVKQHLPKLVVAQTVPSLRVAYDESGRHCLNNVRVNAVFTQTPERAWFLLGVLNAPVADFIFRAIAKRKVGGYFEANKQFIAPLPIPTATAEQEAAVAARARRLQALHTRRARAEALGVELEFAAEISVAERELDVMIYALYGLSEAEIELIETGELL